MPISNRGAFAGTGIPAASSKVAGLLPTSFLLAILPPGAFIGLGLMLALKNLIDKKKR